MSIRAHTSAPRLDALVRFERPVLNADGDIASWTLLKDKVHAAIDGQKAAGAERVVADGTRSVVAYTVWVRSDIVERLQLQVRDRCVYRRHGSDRYLNIQDIPDQGRRGRLIALLCEAGVNKG